jgi:hypothetical protein
MIIGVILLIFMGIVLVSCIASYIIVETLADLEITKKNLRKDYISICGSVLEAMEELQDLIDEGYKIDKVVDVTFFISLTKPCILISLGYGSKIIIEKSPYYNDLERIKLDFKVAREFIQDCLDEMGLTHNLLDVEL